jgi:acylglycerol lipase
MSIGRLPLLILHGKADKAAKSSGSQVFYDRAGSTDKTLKLYDGHFMVSSTTPVGRRC